MKYYFAYHHFNNIAFGTRWMEENGATVGGKPKITTTPIEISEAEFSKTSLAKLEQIYPFYSEDIATVKPG